MFFCRFALARRATSTFCVILGIATPLVFFAVPLIEELVLSSLIATDFSANIIAADNIALIISKELGEEARDVLVGHVEEEGDEEADKWEDESLHRLGAEAPLCHHLEKREHDVSAI